MFLCVIGAYLWMHTCAHVLKYAHENILVHTHRYIRVGPMLHKYIHAYTEICTYSFCMRLKMPCMSAVR